MKRVILALLVLLSLATASVLSGAAIAQGTNPARSQNSNDGG